MDENDLISKSSDEELPFPSGNCTELGYVIEGDVLVKYSGKGGAVIIPPTVRVIGKKAFAGCTSMTAVIIPNGVTTILDCAFERCRGLTSVTIPDSVTRVARNAIWGCNKIETVTIGRALCFADFTTATDLVSLRAIFVSDENNSLKSVDGVLYNKEGSRLLRYPPAKEGEDFAVPEGVRVISNSAFIECQNLRSVSIPDGVTRIEWMAFWLAVGIKDVSLHTSLTEIGDAAFWGCKNATIHYCGTKEQWRKIKKGSRWNWRIFPPIFFFTIGFLSGRIKVETQESPKPTPASHPRA